MENKAASRIKNEESVDSLVEKLNRSKSVVLTDQSGLSVSLASELKKKLRGVDAESLVTKNTLLKIASQKSGYEIPTEALEGPTAVVFGYGDEIAPIKELTTFAKTNEKPVLKTGFLGSDLLSAEKITELAKLPSKEILQGKVVGGLASPLYGMVGVLNANLRNLVYAIDQIRLKGGVN
ncbi:MAG TPA: 50S ribosomal protein L10 [Candidatus Saccharimonadales bacterium]|nr:50S ribosomal protein L10 [Candidatus Saccharimonadales bacterium]